jgi:hypothetical protein
MNGRGYDQPPARPAWKGRSSFRHLQPPARDALRWRRRQPPNDPPRRHRHSSHDSEATAPELDHPRTGKGHRLGGNDGLWRNAQSTPPRSGALEGEASRTD